MNFKAEIDIMPLAGLLDPQGKAVSRQQTSQCVQWFVAYFQLFLGLFEIFDLTSFI